MTAVEQDDAVAALVRRGVCVVDPRQTFIAPDVRLERVRPGAVLHPGTRLHGPRTFIGPRAEIGAEGPAVIHDSVFAAGTSIASGYARGAVLLEGASLGANAHVRPATLLEEEASTAHAVGLKHTLLLAFATLGSLINFCDVLLAGGTSRKDHSEVGSGFIHFNFTPWGASGDKATPSLLGDVPRGVFLRERRIFIGGLSGLIGPGQVGFGAVTAAGQVVRKSVPAERLVGAQPPKVDLPVPTGAPERSPSKIRRNVAYIGQLVALRTWYRDVRRARIPDGPMHEDARIVAEEAERVLVECIEERCKRLRSYMEERGLPMPELDLDPAVPCPLPVAANESYEGHVAWVRSLDSDVVERGVAWLEEVARLAMGRQEPE